MLTVSGYPATARENETHRKTPGVIYKVYSTQWRHLTPVTEWSENNTPETDKGL